jgi:hypothetical protein
MARYNSLRHLGSSCLCHALSLDMVLCETLNRRAKSACDAEPSARTLTCRAARCHWKVLSRVGGNRYGARIGELKDEGYQIQDDPDPSGDGNRYRLISLEPGEPREKRVKIYLSENDAIALASGRVTENSASIARAALQTFQAHQHYPTDAFCNVFVAQPLRPSASYWCLPVSRLWCPFSRIMRSSSETLVLRP